MFMLQFAFGILPKQGLRILNLRISYLYYVSLFFFPFFKFLLAPTGIHIKLILC